MTVYSRVRIQTKARQLRGEYAYLSTILPAQLPSYEDGISFKYGIGEISNFATENLRKIP